MILIKIIIFQRILGEFANVKFCKNLFIVARVFTGGQRDMHGEINRHVCCTFSGLHKMGLRFCNV
jgi:hypothetical protein